MILFRSYQKEINIGKTPYELFGSIDKLDLTDKFFRTNDYNLVASVDQIKPLTIIFRNDADFFGRKNRYGSSTTVTATFLEDGNQSKVVLSAKSSTSVYFIGLFLVVALFFNIFRHGPIVNTILLALAIALLIPIDISTKRSLFERVESILQNN